MSVYESNTATKIGGRRQVYIPMRCTCPADITVPVAVGQRLKIMEDHGGCDGLQDLHLRSGLDQLV